jgi:aryl-alcohol dehydrogenase-like predicted oxidoreductase
VWQGPLLAFSNWPAWAVSAALEKQKANGWARFSHGQMHYSLLGRDIERDVIPMMQNYGIGLTVWSPLAFGFLSGKFTRENLKQEGTRFAENDLLPFDKEHGFALVENMCDIGRKHCATVAQIALCWLLDKRPVSCILLGATKLSQLDENIAAMDVRLPPDVISQLDAATMPALVYPYWFIDKFVDMPLQRAMSN